MALTVEFGSRLRQREYYFDEDCVFLNHGAYGGVPRRVMEVRRRLLEETERHPDRWYRISNPRHHRDSLQVLSRVIGATETNLVFVENATAAEVIRVELTFPISREQILETYKEALDSHPNIKLAIIAHITSPTAVLMPIRELSEMCSSRGVRTLVDGAHALGQLDLAVEELGVDFYTGNAHKWFFTPRGCAFLWISPDYHDVIKPSVVSHFHGYKLHYDFCVRGTRDDTPYHTIPEAVRFFRDLGGLEAIWSYTSSLLDTAVRELESSWNTEQLGIPPDLQAPYMRLVRLPDMANYPKTPTGGGDVEGKLFEQYKIQTFCMCIAGELYIRLSAHVYSTADDFRRVGAAILNMSREPPEEEKQEKGYNIPLMHWNLSPLTDL